MKRAIDTTAIMRPAAVAMALVSGVQPASATVTLHCNPVENVEPAAATALCDAFALVLATSKWANADGVTMQLDVNTLRPTTINVTLNMTNTKGDAHTINRGLSASDTTINPTMQAAFLKKLLAAIPSNF